MVRIMDSRRILVALVLTLLGSTGLGAQNRVHTETIIPPADIQAPAAPAPIPAPTPAPVGPTPPPPLNLAPPMPTTRPAPAATPAPPAAAPAPLPPVRSPPPDPGRRNDSRASTVPAFKPSGRNRPPQTVSAILTDVAVLPPAVARMRARILEAARTGDLDKVLTVMQSNETMPIFSFANEREPTAYWRANYPDSGGLEVLAILVEILDMGFVHVDAGTPQDMYVWPYFAYVPLKQLTPAQKVELFKIVTGSDYRAMQDFGAYISYRIGIGPDGTWHFFVSGD